MPINIGQIKALAKPPLLVNSMPHKMHDYALEEHMAFSERRGQVLRLQVKIYKITQTIHWNARAHLLKEVFRLQVEDLHCNS